MLPFQLITQLFNLVKLHFMHLCRKLFKSALRTCASLHVLSILNEYSFFGRQSYHYRLLHQHHHHHHLRHAPYSSVLVFRKCFMPLNHYFHDLLIQASCFLPVPFNGPSTCTISDLLHGYFFGFPGWIWIYS